MCSEDISREGWHLRKAVFDAIFAELAKIDSNISHSPYVTTSSGLSCEVRHLLDGYSGYRVRMYVHEDTINAYYSETQPNMAKRFELADPDCFEQVAKFLKTALTGWTEHRASHAAL